MEEQFGDWETEESSLILNPDFNEQDWVRNNEITIDSITIEEVSQ